MRGCFLTGAVRFCVAVLLLALPGAAYAVQGKTVLPEIAGLHIGFGGRYKVGLWTPVEVILRGGSRPAVGRVSLVVPDGEGVASQTSTPDDEPCRVAAGSQSRVVLYARFGRVHSTATVRFETDDGAAIQRQFRSSANPGVGEYLPALGADRKLVVCVSAPAAIVEEAAAQVDFDPDRQPVVVRLDDAAALPTQWYGYEGVDAVVVATDHPETYEKPAAEDDPRAAAMDRWIRLGGRLLVLSGPRPDLADDPEQRPWVRTVRGFGQVTFLGVDPDPSALDPWGGRGALVARLLHWPQRAEEATADLTGDTQMGFGDISGQLRAALDRFTGVQVVPFGVVVAVILVYLVLIGPIDYWMLARWKRLGWTWLTFPLVIVIFGAGAYVAAYHLKGTELRLNQVDLVDVDAASGLVRGTHWSNLYSPRVDTYSLSLRPEQDGRWASGGTPVNFAWLGLPGSGLGGMDPKTVNPSPWRIAYRFSPPLDRIVGLPIETWSTRSFTGRWIATWEDDLGANLVRRDDEPAGRLTNPLDVELKSCLFIYDRWVYDLGSLGPRAAISLDALPERSELRTLLTGARRVMDDRGERMEQRVTPYKVRSVDPFYVLRTMMFFEHAGGRHYTRLSNEYQSYVDLSHMLGPNCAVLIGAANAPATTLCRDADPLEDAGNRRLTVYRFVLPVKEP